MQVGTNILLSACSRTYRVVVHTCWLSMGMLLVVAESSRTCSWWLNMMQLGVYLCEINRCCATIARSYHSSLMRIHYLCAVTYFRVSLNMGVVRIAEVVNGSSYMGYGEPQDGNQSMVRYIFRSVDDQEASSSTRALTLCEVKQSSAIKNQWRLLLLLTYLPSAMRSKCTKNAFCPSSYEARVLPLLTQTQCFNSKGLQNVNHETGQQLLGSRNRSSR